MGAILPSMNINLTEHQEKFVRDLVSSGDYANAAEVVREAIRLFEEERRWRAELRRKVLEGVEDLKAGRVVDGATAMGRMKARIAGAARNDGEGS